MHLKIVVCSLREEIYLRIQQSKSKRKSQEQGSLMFKTLNIFFKKKLPKKSLHMIFSVSTTPPLVLGEFGPKAEGARPA